MSFYYSTYRSTHRAYPAYPAYPATYPATYPEYYPLPASPTFLRRVPAVLGVVQRPVKALMDILHGKTETKATKQPTKDIESVMPEDSLESLDYTSEASSVNTSSICDLSEIHEMSEANRKMFDTIDYLEMDKNNAPSTPDNYIEIITDCYEEEHAWNAYYEYDYVPKKDIWNYACMVSPADIESGLNPKSCAYDYTDFDKVVCPESRILYASA